jgi:hypothetical protein
LRIRNGPDVMDILQLPLQSNVLVWREKDGWTGPFKLLSIDGHNCVIEMPYGPTNFRSTVVKPYYIDTDISGIEPITVQEPDLQSSDIEIDITPQKKRRGRPKGSKNKVYSNEQFLTSKEKGDLEYSLKLRQEGVITESGNPF